MTTQVENLLEDAIARWQQFANELMASAQGGEFHQGLATGFEAAAEELQSLLLQVRRVQSSPLRYDDISLEIHPQDHASAHTPTYTYIGFAQDALGVWRVKHLNGVWQPNWERGLSFDSAVQQMHQAGWKLERFASGLCVFKRIVQP